MRAECGRVRRVRSEVAAFDDPPCWLPGSRAALLSRLSWSVDPINYRTLRLGVRSRALYGIGLSLFMLGFSVMESRRGNANQVTIFEMFFCAALLIGFVTLFIDLFSNATFGSPGDLIVIFLSVGYLLVSVYWVVIMAIRTAQAGLWSS